MAFNIEHEFLSKNPILYQPLLDETVFPIGSNSVHVLLLCLFGYFSTKQTNLNDAKYIVKLTILLHNSFLLYCKVKQTNTPVGCSPVLFCNVNIYLFSIVVCVVIGFLSLFISILPSDRILSHSYLLYMFF
jgi:hypothetical protein